MKKLILVLTILFSISSFSQEIVKERGRYFVNGKQISTRETRELLTSNPEALKLFKSGKSKESTGGLLIGFGTALVTVDLAIGLFSDVKYPTVATYIGVASLIASFPVLAGKNKKLKDGIDLYNKGAKKIGQIDTDFELNVIANHNGYGIQFIF